LIICTNFQTRASKKATSEKLQNPAKEKRITYNELKKVMNFLFHEELLEILHFYSTYIRHPPTPPSVLKLEG